MREILFCIIFIAGFVFTSLFLAKAECKIKSVSFEDYKYHYIGGCMVKHNGKWLPIENIRGFD